MPDCPFCYIATQGLPLFPNPVLAEGLLDRLLNSAYVVTLLGRSYRQRQRPADQEIQTTWGQKVEN